MAQGTRRNLIGPEREMREPSKERRARVLAVAADVIHERGIGDTRIADVASRAGMSSGHVMYYFHSKDELLLEAVRAAEDGFYADAVAKISGVDGAHEKLVRLIDLWCPRGAASAETAAWVLWPDLWSRAMHAPELASLRESLDRRWSDLVAEIVREGRRQKVFAGADPQVFALQLAAFMDGLAVRVMSGDSQVNAARMRKWCREFAAEKLRFTRIRRSRTSSAGSIVHQT